MDIITIEPCSYCGSTASLTHHNFNPETYQVICLNCGATGSRQNLEYSAIVAWNMVRHAMDLYIREGIKIQDGGSE